MWETLCLLNVFCSVGCCYGLCRDAGRRPRSLGLLLCGLLCEMVWAVAGRYALDDRLGGPQFRNEGCAAMHWYGAAGKLGEGAKSSDGCVGA